MVLLRYSLLVRLGLQLRRLCLALADALVTPQLALFERSIGLSETMLLAVVSELGIADIIAEKPYTITELAARSGAHPDLLERMLRALSDRGIFRLQKNGELTHTRLSRALRSHHPSALKAWSEYYGSESQVKAWADLKTTARDGRAAFDRVFGESVWDYFGKHPKEEETFAQAMMGVTRSQAIVIEALYDFSQHSLICDIGGGRGTLLAYILRKNPKVRGILLDAKGVLESARRLLEEEGLQERVERVEGNFFEAIPEGADCFLLKNILHDWNDEVCLRILKTLHRAMREEDKVLILEQLLGEFEPNPIASFSHMQMIMACSEGRERSLEEFKELFQKAGFRLDSVKKHPVISVLALRKI